MATTSTNNNHRNDKKSDEDDRRCKLKVCSPAVKKGEAVNYKAVDFIL